MNALAGLYGTSHMEGLVLGTFTYSWSCRKIESTERRAHTCSQSYILDHFLDNPFVAAVIGTTELYIGR